MDEVCDAFAFLEDLKNKKQKEKQSFSDFTDYLEQKARDKGIPLNGQFELTPLCNFQCKMCYVALTKEQLCQPLLTPEQWNGLISEACNIGMLRATLSGGECLSYPGFKDVYEHLQNLGCEVEIFTNGFLLDEEWISYFIKHPPASFQITLYGDNDNVYEQVTGHRAFETALHHIQLVKNTNLPLRISVTPSKVLGEDVFETMRLAKELSRNVVINGLLSKPRQETGRAEQDLDLDDEFYIRIERFKNELYGISMQPCAAEQLPTEGGSQKDGILYGIKCGAGRSGFNIDWRGVMNPCNELGMIQAYPLQGGFKQAWQQIHYRMEHWPRAAICEDCIYTTVCEKCAGRILHYSPPGTCPRSLCKRTKKFVQQGVYSIPCNKV